MNFGLNLAFPNPAGAAGGRVARPAPLINLEGDDLSQITFGTGVDIQDWGGFEQLTTTEQPSHDGTMNGNTVPSFAGDDEFLERSQIPITDMTFLFALQKDTNPLTKTLMAQIDTSGPTDIWFIAVTSNGIITMKTGGANVQSSSGAIPDNTPLILSIVCEIGQNVKLYVDGVDVTNINSVWNPAAGANKLIIGGRRSVSPLATWDGLIARAQLWNTALSDSDRQYYENLATTKWIP